MRFLTLGLVLFGNALGAQVSVDSSRGAANAAFNVLRPSATLRLWSADRTLWAQRMKLDAIMGDTLVVSHEMDSAWVLRKPLASFARVEVNVPRTLAHGTVQGIKIGTIVGFMGGAILTVVAYQDKKDYDGVKLGEVALFIGIPFFTVSGTVLGAAVGAITRGKYWRCAINAPCNRI